MNDPNRTMKWLLLIGLVVLSIVILYPPHEKLKGGIDLVGGTSLLFEIDTTGLDASQQSNLSAKVMRILKDRVDPKGQLNLEWRPVGNARLEIRMPRPPKEALERREAYNAAIEEVKAVNLSRFDIESALNETEAKREAALKGLIRGIDERAELITRVKMAYDQRKAALATEDEDAIASANEAYEEAMSALLETSLPINRLRDTLALENPEKRQAELEGLRAKYPSYAGGAEGSIKAGLMGKVVRAYDAWAENKAELEDPSDLKRRIRGAGVLEFRILADRDPSSPSLTADPNPQRRQSISKYTEQLAKYGPRPKAGDRYIWLPVTDILQFMYVDDMEEFEKVKESPSRPIVAEYAGRWYALMHNEPEYCMLQSSGGKRGWELKAAFPDRDPMTGRNTVSFQLDARGGQLFGELTGANVGRQLCIMLDDVAMSHARINERITERCQISGDFTLERVQELVRVLEAGSLPARLKETPLSEQTIGPSLGETNRVKGLRSAVIGGIAVAVFVLIYYGLVGGGMADIALMLNLLFVLAIMALMQATFTLPGIAGLILTVGMAIDANVLIFERIREERDRGVIFKKALNTGYDKAFSTIMDANLTTLLTCVVLGFVGSQEVKGFAIVLGIGIVTSMFTALVVTRLVFNTLISNNLLKDFRMLRIIGRPSIDWIGLRRIFWPVSTLAVVGGLAVFVSVSVTNKAAVYDIEFLGGTSVQIDLKPDEKMSDEQVVSAITGAGSEGEPSAAAWLQQAADQLDQATVERGRDVGVFTLSAEGLTGDQLEKLMFETIEDKLEHRGTHVSGRTVDFVTKAGTIADVAAFEREVHSAAQAARTAAKTIRGARVQSVGDLDEGHTGHSYEVATTETNRSLVQAAIIAVLGDRLDVQRAISFTAVQDQQLTREPFFVVEADDEYLSDVIGGDESFDIRRFRGGMVVEVVLDKEEEPLSVAEFEKRLREVGLLPEYEQFRTLESTIIPLAPKTDLGNGDFASKHFAAVAVDDSLRYDDDPVQWTALARTRLAQIEAALGAEKSLSKVVAFAPQIASQTKNRAIFAIVLALAGIVSYLWLRFGTKEYGLAAIVALVHDVSITLGLVTLGHFVYDTVVGKLFLISDFKVDLPMIAAILTVIGYSLNDTIVVFDRIRENKGKLGSLTSSLINNSINQTLSRTLLTSITTFLVVVILYAAGGKGVHGFSFALIVGVIVGTYSSIGVATPLLYQPALLRKVVTVIVMLVLVGIVFAEVESLNIALITSGVIVAVGLLFMFRPGVGRRHAPTRQPAGA